MQMSADLSNALKFGSTMQALQQTLNTDKHLNALTNAGYEVLRDAFNTQMHMAAQSAAGTLLYHHVYEWEHVGEPGFQLWKMNLTGRGGNKSISWNWRPSKTTVPTMTNVNGTDKFLPSKGFDPSKLNRIHIFVWKAPIMEYGVTVTVRPRLSHVLVFPNNQQQGAGGRMGPGTATFTGDVQTITPGAQVQGNFTAAFIAFFGSQANQVLENSVKKPASSAFAKAFHDRLLLAGVTKSRTKTFSLTPNAAAAKEGANIARAIAGDTSRAYYRMAEQRKRRSGSEDEI